MRSIKRDLDIKTSFREVVKSAEEESGSADPEI
jgi:hypothetical protein